MKWGSSSWHSQMVSTRHPDRRSSEVLLLSRATFSENFLYQKARLVAGVVA